MSDPAVVQMMQRLMLDVEAIRDEEARWRREARWWNAGLILTFGLAAACLAVISWRYLNGPQ